MSYSRFAAMIATSTVAMFAFMYLNTWDADHIFFSQTRTWMALLMGAGMAVIMIGFMWSMYPSLQVNIAILAVGFLVFGLSLWLVRSQRTVSDLSFMRAMIPHHSIAIMTSDRANIRDPRVRKLADDILRTQVREIDEMAKLIAELETNPPPADAPRLPPQQVGQ